MRCRKTTIGIMVAGAFACAHAQWLNYPSPDTPRTRDGKPNLSAKTPRAAIGKPDLSGVWQIEPPPAGEIERLFGDFRIGIVPGDDPTTFSKYFLDILADFKPEEAPIRPAAAALMRKRQQSEVDPTTHCLPAGLPRPQLLAFPFKIVQNPKSLIILHEMDGTHRQIYTDGRKLPVDPQPAWLGYSVGRWEGETLVVDSTGFNDKTWLDAFGHPHSEAMRIQERYRRRDFGHMDVEVTIDDPEMYTRPFTIKFSELLVPDSDIIETVCNENEKDRAHIGRN